MDAASYQKHDGTIADFRWDSDFRPRPTGECGLEPYADLTYAILYDANLTDADLSGSNLSSVLYYDYATWTNAFYYTDNEPTWHSGMNAAWRTSKGILAIPPVPEPASILLALLGLAFLPLRRRR